VNSKAELGSATGTTRYLKLLSKKKGELKNRNVVACSIVKAKDSPINGPIQSMKEEIELFFIESAKGKE
jgi:hypothetical protein